MIKKLLVVLDKSKSCNYVEDTALKIAENTNSKLTVLGILDTSYIKIQHSEPLSGIAFDIENKDELISNSHANIIHLMDNFAKKINNKKLFFQTLEVQGNPIEEIEYLSCENDLIIMSNKPSFQFDEEETDYTVRKIARDSPRPLILVPKFSKISTEILIAYDGSLSAIRSLHIFLLLGLWKNYNIHILSIDSDEAKAKECCKQANTMCNLYNVVPKEHTIISNKNPEELILNKAKEINAWLVVIGSFKHTQIHDALFTSTTAYLINKTETSLFIYR